MLRISSGLSPRPSSDFNSDVLTLGPSTVSPSPLAIPSNNRIWDHHAQESRVPTDPKRETSFGGRSIQGMNCMFISRYYFSILHFCVWNRLFFIGE